ncbi:MAG TPA: hypothetical protein VD866_12055 [Urbifossiella sp.]|nr:hypothetical protein [Urbifossiella sp.]
MGKKKVADEEGKASESRTTTALYTADSLDLKQLAAMLDISAADTYRRLLAPVVKTALRAELKRRSSELDREKS